MSSSVIDRTTTYSLLRFVYIVILTPSILALNVSIPSFNNTRPPAPSLAHAVEPSTPRYPIPGTKPILTLKRKLHYAPGSPRLLPHLPLISLLAAARIHIDGEISERGRNAHIDYGWTFVQSGLQVFFNSVEEMVLGEGSSALEGLRELVTTGLLEMTEMEIELRREETMLSIIWIAKQIEQKIDDSSGGEAPKPGVAGGQNVTVMSNNVGHSIGTSSRTGLNPKDYRVPRTGTTISLDGAPPYGTPLPDGSLIAALVSAQDTAKAMIQRWGTGIVLPPGLWRFEKSSIRLDIYTQVEADCTYGTVVLGLQGLIDLMTEPDGIGAVAAGFSFKEEGQGKVAEGQLSLLEQTVRVATSTKASVTMNGATGHGAVVGTL